MLNFLLNFFLRLFSMSMSVLGQFSCFSTRRKKAATAVSAQLLVKMIIGMGSSKSAKRKLSAEKRRAKKLQIPSADAANSVGKKN